MAEAESNTPTQNSLKPLANLVMRNGDIILAFGVIGILLVLLIPVPTFIMDVLLAFSMTSAVLILMTTLFIQKPLELSAFPTLLLVTAITRLSLNIASTRLILADGDKGSNAAGHVIEAFGGFVMQGNVVIGIIVFAILTIINFVVITKGSGRIAEVAARFSLDSMPGKQMAIDADLSAGIIDEKTAKRRRQELEDESTFYGAMDGANKFVRGDAIAGLLITLVNFIGGILIGMGQRNLNFSEAMHTYSMLTIGDGLVSQVPSLIISLSAGLLVSKSGVVGATHKVIFGQIGNNPKSIWVASLLTALMALMPGLPMLPFMILSFACAAMGYSLKIAGESAESSEESSQSAAQASGGQTQATSSAQAADSSTSSSSTEASSAEEEISSVLYMDQVRIELGYGLLPLINYSEGHRLTDQVKALRKQIARELGFIIPSTRVQDNLELSSDEYVIKIKEIESARGEVRVNKLLVMDPAGESIDIDGEETTEPAFGLKAKWIDQSNREVAINKHYTVVDPSTVITTHLTEIIKDNIPELLSYIETQKLIEELPEESKKFVKEIVPEQVSISLLQKVLQNLLSESVSIRDLPNIVEAIADITKETNNITEITENTRMRLARQISNANTNSEGYIPVVTLSEDWEKTMYDNLSTQQNDNQLSLPPSELQEFVNKIKSTYDQQAAKGELPVLLTSPTVRPYVRSIIERFRSSIIVMSQNEIHQKSKIKTIGVVSK